MSTTRRLIAASVTATAAGTITVAAHAAVPIAPPPLPAPPAAEPELVALSFVVALVFAGIHLLGRAMTFLRTTPRSI